MCHISSFCLPSWCVAPFVISPFQSEVDPDAILININHVLHVVLVLREILEGTHVLNTCNSQGLQDQDAFHQVLLTHLCWGVISNESWNQKKPTLQQVIFEIRTQVIREGNELLFLERWSCTRLCESAVTTRAHSLFFSKKMSWPTFTVEMNQSFPAGTVNSFMTHVDLHCDIVCFGWPLSCQRFPKTSNNGKCLIETTYGPGSIELRIYVHSKDRIWNWNCKIYMRTLILKKQQHTVQISSKHITTKKNWWKSMGTC